MRIAFFVLAAMTAFDASAAPRDAVVATRLSEKVAPFEVSADTITQVLAAFSDACNDPSSIATVRAAAIKGGWQELIPDPDSLFGSYLSVISPTLSQRGGEFATFHRSVGGRDLQLVVTSSDSLISITGCRVYDFAASTPYSEEIVSHWVGRGPSSRHEQPGHIIASAWKPGLSERQRTFELMFVSPDSWLNAGLDKGKMVGASLFAQFVGAPR